MRRDDSNKSDWPVAQPAAGGFVAPILLLLGMNHTSITVTYAGTVNGTLQILNSDFGIGEGQLPTLAQMPIYPGSQITLPTVTSPTGYRIANQGSKWITLQFIDGGGSTGNISAAITMRGT